jgi:hypothetical protein
MMDAVVLVIAIFAVVVIVVAVAFRHRLKAIIKGPGGTGLEIDAAHPLPRPGVRIDDARSRRGGLTATDHTGRGAEASKIEVDKDINVSSHPAQEYVPPKSPPPA